MCGALLDFPPSLTGHVMAPIYASLVAWFVISVTYLMGQAATKHWSGVVLGSISTVASFVAYEPIVEKLRTIVVPLFVSTLNLEAGTKVLIGGVFGFAFLYVFLSPAIWERYLKMRFEQEPRLIVQRFLEIYPRLDGSTRSLIREILSRDGT